MADAAGVKRAAPPVPFPLASQDGWGGIARKVAHHHFERLMLWARRKYSRPNLARDDGHMSLKRAAWTYGCAKKGSDTERLLRDRLLLVVTREQGKVHGVCTRGEDKP